MKKILLILFLSVLYISVHAQDLLDELDKTVIPKKSYSTATFKSTRVINGHSIETISKNHLDFRISHRFGRLNDGAYNFFGLDQATMRMGLEYGLTDRLMVAIGRSTSQKTFDYFAKYKVLRQAKGGSPISVTAFGSVDAISLSTSPQFRFNDNFDRLTYIGQLLIARKFGERLSLQLTPTFIHRNKVESDTEPNDIMAVGIGGRVKISKRTSLNAEYFYRLPMSLEAGISTNPNYYNSLSLGFDIETGGHVFQLHFTNSLGMVERQFIAQTEGNWAKGDVHYGFNISRTFSFDKKKKI